MRGTLRFSWLLPWCVATMVALIPQGAAAQEAEFAELIELHRQLVIAKRLQNDTAMLATVALKDYVVIPPAGLVENRDEALYGVRNFRSDSVQVDVQVVASHDSTAVLVGTVAADGRVAGPVLQFAKVRFMAVYVRTGGAWRLLAQSNTPCHERAIQAGRC